MEMSRRSRFVVLTLIGLPIATVAGASLLPGRGDAARRNFYDDRAVCERDYSPQQCEPATTAPTTPATTTTTGSAYHGGWYGPSYAANRATAPAGDPGAGRVGNASRVMISGRGGFGGTGHASAASS